MATRIFFYGICGLFFYSILPNAYFYAKVIVAWRKEV